MSRSGFVYFVLRRLAIAVVLLLLISLGVFVLLNEAPGNLASILLGPKQPSPQALATVNHQYHLNDSVIVRYLIWLKGALHFNFGTSTQTGQSVVSVIGSRLGVSLFLGIYGFILAMLVGVPLGIVAAIRKRTVIDRAAVGLSVVGVSAPAYATGIYLLFIFGVKLNWFPVYGPGGGFAGRLWHLSLPAVALALTAMALVVKLTRVAMIQALDQDYIVFARARGLSYRRVLFAYAFRNALVPVITGGGAILGYMLTGAVLVEVTFALPGVGALLISSVTYKDFPVVLAIAMLLATTIILVNLLTDILYVAVDPRIRFSRGVA
jgi:peptide/nickel transport system permease protein